MAEILAVPRRVGTDLVFSTSSGRPLDERNVLRRFDAALERAGIRPPADADLDKYRPHDLRHAFATLLLEAGVTSHVVGRWLGHRSLAMLDRYAHVHARPGGDAYRRLVDAWGDDVIAFGLRPPAAHAASAR
jgi:site-specific recombinase XerD